jgi:prepilin-type N-terminal cleavage/methylation domain-containing protein
MQKLWHSLLAAGRKGFTMVELLVVVAILGILAVVAISALDPVEQINKGRDTTARADATELAQGIDRWYANTQMFPLIMTQIPATPKIPMSILKRRYGLATIDKSDERDGTSQKLATDPSRLSANSPERSIGRSVNK